MLERYEQKVLLEYLLEALSKIRVKSYSDLKDRLENCIDNINVAYLYGAINFAIKIDVEKEKNNKLSVENKAIKYRNLLLRELKKEYKKIKNTKISNRQKCFNVIKKIFNLTDEEIDIFGLFVRNEISRTFCDCLCLGMDFRGNVDKISMCNAYLENSATKHESLEHLYDLGLLNYDGRRGLNVGIPHFLESILDNSNSIKTKDLISKFMGNKAKATLKKEDFAHLKDNFRMLQVILKNALEQKAKGINILLYGSPGTGKTEFAKTMARTLKVPLYETKYMDDENDEASRNERLTDLKRKLSICKNSDTKQLILFDESEDVFNDTRYYRITLSKAYINRMLEENSIPVIWTTNNIDNIDKAYLRRFTYSIKFEELDEDLQLKFLKKEFHKNNFYLTDEEIKKLSTKYNLSSSNISNSIKLLKLTDLPKEKFEYFIKNQAILLNGGKEVSEKFNINKKSENYNFKLINTDIRMDELTKKIKQTGNLNFSLCLYGEAGTGKSEYAKQLASELGMEVIFKKASDIMSKWVGGTEENIAAAFKEARDKKAVLIFDEADSFLQSRNNAQRSWEISQVNEMLTWMESHPYPFICTTNFMDSLDEASLRRFTFKIKFKYMTNEQVKLGFKHFFDKDVNENIANIKGLTAGDFATVKKKIKFLGIDDTYELKQMLEDEVKVKKSKELAANIGF